MRTSFPHYIQFDAINSVPLIFFPLFRSNFRLNIFSVNHDNIIQTTEIILLNGFLKKDTKALAWYYGKALRDKRKELKITQKQLAEKIGKKREYVALLEKGETDMQLSTFFNISQALGMRFMSPVGLSKAINGNPTKDTLEKIATALDVSVTELFDQPATDIINCPYYGGKIKVSKE